MQQHNLQVLIIFDRAEEEPRLPPGLAFEVQDLLAPILDDDQGLPDVILGDHLARLRRNPKAENARARLRRGEAQPHRRRLAVGGQHHLLGADDPSLVFDVERHGRAPISRLDHDHVDDQRRALEDRAGGLDPAELDILRKLFATQPHRKDRHPGGLQRQERLGEGRLGVVRAVGDHHQTGERQPRELLVSPLEGLTEVRLGTRERQVIHRLETLSGGGEAEEAKGEAVGERGEQCALGSAELLLHEGTSCLAVSIGNLHAP